MKSVKYSKLRIDFERCKDRFMNIQIFGTKKCNNTKKAQRYFEEYGIKFQFIDLNEKEISKGEIDYENNIRTGM